MYMSKGCHQLTHLGLDGCNYITDYGLMCISKGCRQLTHLGLDGCNDITDTGIQDIKSKNAQIRVIS
jgi:F-box/leucine-rich repeat protein 2/20